MSNSKTKNRGFASMGVEQKKTIAAMGGKAVSSNKAHMSEIGKKGGTISGASRRKRKEEMEAVLPKHSNPGY